MYRVDALLEPKDVINARHLLTKATILLPQID